MRRIYLIPVLLGLLWTLLLGILFAWNAVGERRHIMELAEHQTKALFQQIVTTRSWNSAYGGVFVPLGPASEPNPYLPENQRVLRTEVGQVLVKINPAYMTRQLGDITAKSIGTRFRIMSLAPIRPENGPDTWEKEALSSLAPGQERFELVPGPGGNDQFRYMAPIVAEESCLICHPQDQVGKIRGGIDVSMPAEPLFLLRDANLRTQATAYGIIWLVGLVGLGGSTYEISRKRELAENLSRVRSRFLANMSHDMRTPLTGIMGLSQRMLHDGGLDSRNAQYASLMNHSAGTLLEIVNDILDFARLDSGRLELSARPFDLRDAVERTVRIFSFAAGEKALAFSSEVGPDVPRLLEGDEFRYRQVLANLLGNAIKFTEHGFVRLSIHAAPDGADAFVIKTVVADSGVGIHPEYMETIFSSFSQADDSLSRRHAGSGLGLSIARQVARLMGGDVTVTSAPNEGSKFTFTARMQKAPAESALPAACNAGAQEEKRDTRFDGGLKILVVDDHNVNRTLLRDILQESGAEVILAGGGREALGYFEQECFDLVLTDLQMPEMDGVETILRVREIERTKLRGRTPVIVLTAFASTNDIGELPREEIDGLFTKPIDVEALKRAIMSITGDRGSPPPRETEQASRPARPLPDAAGFDSVPLLEPEGAMKLLGGRPDLYRLMINEFLLAVEGLHSDFEQALARGDRREMARAFHTLKSNSAAIGALRLRDCACLLELQASGSGDVDREHYRHLVLLLDHTVQAIRTISLVQ